MIQLLEQEFTLGFPDELRSRWKDAKKGELLIEEYYGKYKERLFDEGNLLNAMGQHHLGYHFVEWWTAIQLHDRYGLLSLVGKYAGRYPKRDREIREWRTSRFREIVRKTDDREFLRDGRLSVEHGAIRLRLPDLLVYTEDREQFGFVEVKGPGDSLRSEQGSSFQAIRERLHRQVSVAKLRAA